jgi:hypothetical protein
MEIVFAGICCWVDAKAPKAGKTVIIPNAKRGGAHRGSLIPPHSAFIHAKRHQVDSSDWQPAVTVDDNLVFMLEGDSITFDPVPSGGAIDVSDLPHVRARITNEPICPAADELRPGFRDHPIADNVLGLVDLSPDAHVFTSSNGHGAMFATLDMPAAPVTIKATPFHPPAKVRSLKITDPSATVFIANVTMMDYLLGNPAPDDEHKFLVCEMFAPRSTLHTMPSVARRRAPMMVAQLSEQATPFDVKNVSGLEGTAAKIMEDFLCGFAAGCSDSQWP